MPADRLTRLDVGPLSMDETDALLRARLGLNLSRPVLARLHAISGGTPFYALELGRDLQRRGGRATPESLEVPRSLDGLIGAHVAALDTAADEVALHAAALSQPTVRVLVAAIGRERVPGPRGGRAPACWSRRATPSVSPIRSSPPRPTAGRRPIDAARSTIGSPGS